MSIVSTSWYYYKLNDYGTSKNNWVPILVIEVDTPKDSTDSFPIEVQTPSTVPTCYGHLYMYDSTGNLNVTNNYYNNNTDPYIKIFGWSDDESYRINVGFVVHAKNDINNRVTAFDVRYSPANYSMSYTAMPIFVHTSDDWYIPSNGTLCKFPYNSLPNKATKGLVKGGKVTLEFKNDFGTSKEKDSIIREILGVAERHDPDNPYDGGDDKGDDDNTSGDYDHTSDPVPEPDLPSVSVTDSGLVTLFAPTESQLKALADYLWSDAFSLDSFKKMLNNPMDCILGLTIVPVNVPRGSAREITVGNIVTTVSCNICPTQYVKVDCGTFTFDRHNMTNSYLDYSPYSKCYLYLPFIGVQEINIDDFMQSTMHVVYHVDILTGAMFCYVMRGNSVMYTYMGQCAENVPLSSNSYSNTIGSIMSAAASIVGATSVVATGGASAPVATGLLAGASTSTANAVTSLKPSVAHSGSIGGGAGIMGVNYPYLIFNTPHVSIPSQQRHYTGYPSNQIVKLSALKGFNVIQAINLSVSGANDSEMNEIESILKGGVIL